MQNLSPRNIFLFIVDLPEFLLRSIIMASRALFFPSNSQSKKIKTLSQNAILIESKHKGLKVISIEVMDGFTVYHSVHRKQVRFEVLEKIRKAVSKTLSNKNVYVSFESGDPRMLKIVIQNWSKFDKSSPICVKYTLSSYGVYNYACRNI